jgi:hypothetical protein
MTTDVRQERVYAFVRTLLRESDPNERARMLSDALRQVKDDPDEEDLLLATATMADESIADLVDPRCAVPATFGTCANSRWSQRMREQELISAVAEALDCRALAEKMRADFNAREVDHATDASKNPVGRPPVAEADEERLRGLIDKHPGDVRTAMKEFIDHLVNKGGIVRKTASRRYRLALKAVMGRKEKTAQQSQQ